MNKPKVLLCLSGGIDSSLSALLLREQGYDVIAATFRVYDSIQEGCLEKMKGCCSIESIAEAKYFAESNGIEHVILDYREYFRETVIQNFIQQYLSAKTPNPCVLCNAEIKWGKVLWYAESRGCDYVATGHYARVIHEEGRYALARGVDILKDQSYFLWMLNQKQLAKTLFPLGSYTKQQVKEMASQRGLVRLVEKRESQEICFIPNNDYREFIEREAKDIKQISGNFVTTDGKIVGQHKGIAFYTIGQRKGLGVAMGEPYYVKEIRVDRNEIVLARYEDLKVKEFTVSNVVWGWWDMVKSERVVEVKIRYRTQPVKVQLKQVDEHTVKVLPLQDVYAVTPGQSAVFYEDDKVLMGGIIEAMK